MKYIGCDFHPSFQQIAMLDKDTGELVERRLLHTEEARAFYEGLRGPVVVGIEASGNTHWFESLLARCQHQLWIGDAAAISRQEGRKQKHDRRAAELILELLRQLKLEPWAGQRRDTLLEMLEELEEKIQPLDQAVAQQAQACAAARRLATHPGVGPVISLATVLTMGDVKRFEDSRSWVSYLGLNPSEESSGQRRRLGGISKQGNPFLRYLLVEGAASAARGDKSLARMYARLKAKKHHGVAKVAVARKLAVRLYWMARTQKSYPEVVRTQGSQSHSVAEVTAVRLNRPPASHG